MSKPTTERTADGWTHTWAEHGLRFRVTPEAGARERLFAEIVVETWQDGPDLSRWALVHQERVELLGRSREAFARYLATRGLRRGLDWTGMVMQACLLTVKAMREGVTAAPRTRTLEELLRADLPEVPQIVPGLLTVGCWILGGKPKVGKSWLVLNLLLAACNGGRALGKLPVESGPVLYLALEDTDNRLQSRALKALGELGMGAAGRFYFETNWSRLDAGGLEELDAWLTAHPGTRLVAIDTLAKARPRVSRQGAGRLYDEDYDAVAGLSHLAGKHGCAIIINHHLSKSRSEDPMEWLSGTMGLGGGVDGVWVLDRKRREPQATLHVMGRDLQEDQELALEWDDHLVTFHVVGDADSVRVSRERAAILDTLRREGAPVSPKDLADMVEMSYGAVRRLLSLMREEGQVRRLDYGKYVPETIVRDQGDHSDHSEQRAHRERSEQHSGRSSDHFGRTDRGDRGDRAELIARSDRSDRAQLHDSPAPSLLDCPSCGQELTDGACYPCDTRRCEVCGEATGFATWRRCVFHSRMETVT